MPGDKSLHQTLQRVLTLNMSRDALQAESEPVKTEGRS